MKCHSKGCKKTAGFRPVLAVPVIEGVYPVLDMQLGASFCKSHAETFDYQKFVQLNKAKIEEAVLQVYKGRPDWENISLKVMKVG